MPYGGMRPLVFHIIENINEIRINGTKHKLKLKKQTK
jgi:hypothetical protein